MLSHTLRLNFQVHIAVRTPQTLLPVVWPLPRSLATTSGISVDFFSSPYLDVSVQAVPLIHLCIQCMMTVLYHRRIAPFGNPRINAYLRLPVAYRSLSRPSSAPSAKAFALRPFSLDQRAAAGSQMPKSRQVRFRFPFCSPLSVLRPLRCEFHFGSLIWQIL